MKCSDRIQLMAFHNETGDLVFEVVVPCSLDEGHEGEHQSAVTKWAPTIWRNDL